MLRVCSLLLLAVFLVPVAGPVLAPTASAQVATENVEPPAVAYEGELPPLIDRQTFFGDPQYANAQISPDGQHVSFTKEYRGMMNVWVKGVDEPFDAAEPVTADTTRPVRGYAWTQDSERILYIQDKGGNENFHLYAVNPDADTETDLGVPPAEDLTPYEDIQAQIIAVPESTPGEIIVGLNDRNPQYHDVYRIDLATGERELLFKNDQRIAGWTTDLQGTLRLATRTTSEGGTEVLRRVQDDSLETVYTCSFEESCGPVRFHPDGERVYMSTNKGSDLQRLVLFHPQTQETELVEKDPEGEVDFGGAIFSDATDELAATVYNGDRQRIYPKSEAFAQDLEFLRNNLDGQVSFGSSTEDESLRIVTASSDVDPGSVYLFNRESQELTRLYRSRPDLPSRHLAEMQAIRYEARDGLEIPAYLTLPTGVEHENLPLVVFPHGGPWARDTWGYNSFAQFLANRGYAVLQPNFRGSTGYGKDFLNAGNEEWGTGAMQHDITDGVQHLVDQGIADPERVGIYGISYGGYATLAGLTFTPERYAAGVSYVGPSNLITLLNSIPPYWASFKRILEKRVGNPEDPQDRERMKRQSPLFSADQIDAPLLVIQGANDPRVPKQESDQIVVAARENGVDVRYMVAPEEGHGFAKENNRLAVAAAMEEFLGTQLGGRSQTSVSEPVQQRLDALAVNPDSVTMPDTTATAGAMSNAEAESALAMIDGAQLSPATLEYNVNMAMRGQSFDLSVSRTIASSNHGDTPTWTVVDQTSTPQGTVTDSLVIHHSSLRPLERRVRGPMTLDVTYADTAATGTLQMRGQTVNIEKGFDQATLAGGSNVRLALASMPLEDGFSTTVNVFNEQQQKVQTLSFEVTDTGSVETEAGTFDTYTVSLSSSGSNGVSGTMHVTQSAPHHVVKSTLEQSSPMGTRTFTRTLTAME
jgi:dipeptidyl aminopeptidase/acylaminoacyl peptidase